MIKITSQKDLDTFLAMPNWEDAFIREWYLLSPTYICPYNQATVAPDAAPMVRVLICTSEITYPGIELFFEEVEEIYLSCRSDLNPVGNFRYENIAFSFHGTDTPGIQAKALYYRILGKDCWGWKIQYGVENVFDESGFLKFNDL